MEAGGDRRSLEEVSPYPADSKKDSDKDGDKDQADRRRDFIHDFYLVVASALVFLLAQTIYNAAIVIFQNIFGPDVINNVWFQIFFVILVAIVVFTVLISRALFFNLF